MLRIYRRHLKDCQYKSERERRCKCPIHCEGTLGDERIERRSLNLTSWTAATKLVHEWVSAGTTKAPNKISLKEAIARYESDCEARKLSPSTRFKISVILKGLRGFADQRGFHLLEQIGVPELREFRGTWKTWGPLTQEKNIERLRAFYRFSMQAKWVTESPAQYLKAPEKNPPKVTVFSKEELDIIHATIKRPIMRAFILVLEHTGLRISDACQLRKQDIENGRLCITTKKTKSTVWLPLPPVVLSALEALHATEYYFWTGESKLSTVIGSKRRGVAKLMERAAVEGHPHKFRHTLATNLLSNGTSVAVVAKILGNSARVVEKYYDHWITERQVKLETELQKTWPKPALALVK